MKSVTRIACGLLALAAAAPAFAQQTSPDAIEREVAAFIGVPASEAASAFVPVDRRLRLAACPRELELQWYGTRRDTVQVRCPVAGSWKLYVRTLAAGQGRQAEAASVKRGDEVTVTLNGGGFSVSQSAEALEQGAVGEWIRVRVRKGSELRARVLRPGAVVVQM